MGKIVNKKTLSEIVGVSERTLTEYQKQGMPMVEDSGRGSANKYDTAVVVDWLIERAINGKQESSRERLERVRGDREEIALAKDLGALVPADEVERAITERILAARTQMIQGAAKLKSELDALHGIDVDIELLNEHSRHVLIQLSGDDEDATDASG